LKLPDVAVHRDSLGNSRSRAEQAGAAFTERDMRKQAAMILLINTGAPPATTAHSLHNAISSRQNDQIETFWP